MQAPFQRSVYSGPTRAASPIGGEIRCLSNAPARRGTPPAVPSLSPGMMSSSERPPGTAPLTPLQQEILVLVVNGLTNRAIAERLGLTPGLVGVQIGRLTRAFGVASRAELVAMIEGRVRPVPP